MQKTYIGIDNGVSGSIGIITPNQYNLHPTPTFSQQDYTKTKQNVTRVIGVELTNMLIRYTNGNAHPTTILIERPMVNAGRFKATKSALRCLEATLIVIESLSLPYQFVDSKEWQKVLLPKGCKKEELKKASHDIGIRLFPGLKEVIEKQKDADGILIAEWGRRTGL